MSKKKKFLYYAVLLFAILFVAKVVFFSSGSAHLQEQKEERKEFVITLEEKGFSLVNEYKDLYWDCTKSLFQGKQIITAEGNNLLFVCDYTGNAYVKVCVDGVNVADIGVDDTCK
jgi:uncharacterized protein (UPF0333 family)